MKLKLQDIETGKKYQWRVFRETNITQCFIGGWRNIASHWFLEDHTGYVRALDENWILSVPIIKTIANNHNLKLCHQLS